MKKLSAMMILFLLLILLFTIGCDQWEDSSDPLPPQYASMTYWNTVSIGETQALLYGNTIGQQTSLTEVLLVFPGEYPCEPEEVELSVSLRRISGNRIRSGVCDPVAQYVPETGVFMFHIAPDEIGSWKLELNWCGAGETFISYYRMIVTSSEPFRRVITNMHEGDFEYVFVWVTPEEPTLLADSFQVQVWRGSQGLQLYEPVSISSLSYQVYKNDFTSAPLTNFAIDNNQPGVYEGNLAFDETGHWFVRILDSGDSTFDPAIFKLDVETGNNDPDNS